MGQIIEYIPGKSMFALSLVCLLAGRLGALQRELRCARRCIAGGLTIRLRRLRRCFLRSWLRGCIFADDTCDYCCMRRMLTISRPPVPRCIHQPSLSGFPLPVASRVATKACAKSCRRSCGPLLQLPLASLLLYRRRYPALQCLSPRFRPAAHRPPVPLCHPLSRYPRRQGEQGPPGSVLERCRPQK